MNRQIILAAALAAMSFGAIQAQAQTQRSILDGVYTDAQAARGAQQYATRCLVCHGAALEGNTLAPPRTGRRRGAPPRRTGSSRRPVAEG